MSLLRTAAKAVFAGADQFLTRPLGPRVLIYHHIGRSSGRQMEVKVEDFIWQIDWVMENRKVVDLSVALERWSEPESHRLVVLTFDDGYSDLFRTAFPLLRDRAMPFTMYLSTKPIESQSAALIDDWLSWDQIAEMIESGLVTVGSHTHTHRDLRYASRAEIQWELSTSDELISKRTGIAPRHFAYPWGFWSSTADSVVRGRYVSATVGAPAHPGNDFDPMKIHRFPVQLSDGRTWFPWRIRGGLLVEERVRRRLRGYDGTGVEH